MISPWLHLVYLSGPIGSTNGAGHTWRDSARDALKKEYGIATFSPAHAYHMGDSKGREDRASWHALLVNREAIIQADAMLCFLPKDKVSLGSCREIEIARSHGRPVVVVFEADHRPHFAVDLEIVNSFPAAFDVIAKWMQMPQFEVLDQYTRS